MSLPMPPIAILAGGLATRMYPLTERVPKALLPVAGEPFLAHQLRLLRREGLHRVVLCVAHFADQIEAFAGDGSSFGLSIAYCRDGNVLRGTGGAIREALPLLGDEFFITYGDSYLDIAFAPIVDAYHASRKSALMTVYRNSNQFDTSNAVYRDGSVKFYSKTERRPNMHYIDYGLALMRGSVLQNPEYSAPFDLARVYSDLVAQGQMAGYEVHRRFYEIGSQAGLKETEDYLAHKGHA